MAAFISLRLGDLHKNGDTEPMNSYMYKSQLKYSFDIDGKVVVKVSCVVTSLLKTFTARCFCVLTFSFASAVLEHEYGL